jgi:hypothetical protein
MNPNFQNSLLQSNPSKRQILTLLEVALAGDKRLIGTAGTSPRTQLRSESMLRTSSTEECKEQIAIICSYLGEGRRCFRWVDGAGGDGSRERAAHEMGNGGGQTLAAMAPLSLRSEGEAESGRAD